MKSLIFCIVFLAIGVALGSVLFNGSDTGENSVAHQTLWSNPYSNWHNPAYLLLGGQGAHFHTISFSTKPDATIPIEKSLQIFRHHLWGGEWFQRGVTTGGYENTNQGYEFVIVGAHNHRRTEDQYKKLLEYTEQIAPAYGYTSVIRAAEVYPPHEGMIWNGLCRDENSQLATFVTNNKVDFVKKVVAAETPEHHSLAVILHPQGGGADGRNSQKSVLEMAKAGAEMIEIFNGLWETGDDLCVNDHFRTGSTNIERAPADGNAEDYWDILLTLGHKIWGEGCDDFHGFRKGVDPDYPAHAYGGNYVWMEVLAPKNPSPEEIVRQLENGAFYVTQGVQIKDIRVENDTITIVGDETVDFIEAIGSVGGETALKQLNQGNGDTGTLLKKEIGNTIHYQADSTTPYDNIYVRFRLVNTDYDEAYYYDEHRDGGGDVYAWTQPFFFHSKTLDHQE